MAQATSTEAVVLASSLATGKNNGLLDEQLFVLKSGNTIDTNTCCELQSAIGSYIIIDSYNITSMHAHTVKTIVWTSRKNLCDSVATIVTQKWSVRFTLSGVKLPQTHKI